MPASLSPVPQSLLNRVHFRQLQMMLALEACGSLRAAAESLHVTQPALSKSLKDLEGSLEVTLFDRTSRGLIATDAGRSVLQDAAVLVAELDQLRRRAQARAAGESAVLRLGATPVVAMNLLPEVLAILRLDAPAITLDLYEDTSPRLFDAIEHGRVDALLTTARAELLTSPTAASLHLQPLREETTVVIAHADDPLATRAKLGWSELSDRPWILPPPSSYVRKVVEESFARAGVIPPRPVVVSASQSTNVRLVASGVGLAMVPIAAAIEAELTGKIRRLAVHPPLPPASVWLVYRSAAAGHPLILRLQDVLERCGALSL